MTTVDDMVAADQKQTALLRAYRDTFENPSGRIVLLDLLREAQVMSIVYDPDPQRTVWNDGKRSLALVILQRLRWTEAELVQLAMAQDEPAFNAISPDAGMDQLDTEQEIF